LGTRLSWAVSPTHRPSFSSLTKQTYCRALARDGAVTLDTNNISKGLNPS
jgi:hypothetical protein